MFFFNSVTGNSNARTIGIALGTTAAVAMLVALGAFLLYKVGGLRNIRKADLFHRRVSPSIDDVESVSDEDDDIFGDFHDIAPPPRSTTLIIVEPIDSKC